MLPIRKTIHGQTGGEMFLKGPAIKGKSNKNWSGKVAACFYTLYCMKQPLSLKGTGSRDSRIQIFGQN